jgi:hypothetical protein
MLFITSPDRSHIIEIDVGQRTYSSVMQKYYYLFAFFLVVLGFKFRIRTCEAGALLLEPRPQPKKYLALIGR